MAFGTTPSNGLEYAAFAATPSRKVAGNYWNSRRRGSFGTVVLAAAAAGSQWNMVRVQKGSKIIGGHVWWTALGASTQLWFGDAFVCDRFLRQANGVVASNNQVGLDPFSGDCGSFNQYAVDGDITNNLTPGSLKHLGYEYSCDADLILTIGYQAAATGTVAVEVDFLSIN